MKFINLFFLSLIFISCSSTDESSAISNISISWELLNNTESKDHSKAVFTLTNKGDKPINNLNWNLYFSQNPKSPITGKGSEIATIKHINGDWFKLTPSSNFKLAPNESVEVIYYCEEYMIKMSDIPMGLYFVTNEGDPDQKIIQPLDFKVIPFTRPEQINMSSSDAVPIPTSETRYRENEGIQIIKSEQVAKVIPSPFSMVEKKGTLTIKDELVISYDASLQSEAEYLKEALSGNSSVNISLKQGKGGNISLQLSSVKVGGVSEEAYKLKINKKRVVIKGSDAPGVFYGIQTLLAVQHKDTSKEVRFPFVTVSDSPRFGYRGFQLDVSRNFQSKETILKVIDLLATYKVNTLLFYVTEDEGWRLEIDGLPELTDIGSQRKHTNSMGDAVVHPGYGSGAYANTKGKHGSGYYTREDYIEILKYANTRHVMVIPEVNLPGHARAAIKAMEHRYNRLMSEGKQAEAEQYRLVDPDDTSIYESAQSFKDNTVCVCRESTYAFYDKVIDEIVKLYKEADAPLEYFHTGGDEVPKGAWTKSPLCKDLIAQTEGLDDPNQLQTYFFRKAVEMLNKKNLKIAGWEEVALKVENEHLVVDTEFVDKNVIPYTWNNLWGEQDLAYKMANRGYPVVLCPVTNFYFDLAYDKDPEEPGLYWAGFVNARNAYECAPLDMFKTTYRNDAQSTPFDKEKLFAPMERLNAEGRRNILGVQSQLWSETVKGPEMLEYYILPKLFGFAETAWAKERKWETIENETKRNKSIDKGWNSLANTIGQREFDRLDDLFGGFNYRIPLPGAIIKDDMLYANILYPGLAIRYTTDGAEPTNKSQIYTQPVKVEGIIKLRAFNAVGRGSRASVIQKKIIKE